MFTHYDWEKFGTQLTPLLKDLKSNSDTMYGCESKDISILIGDNLIKVSDIYELNMNLTQLRLNGIFNAQTIIGHRLNEEFVEVGYLYVDKPDDNPATTLICKINNLLLDSSFENIDFDKFKYPVNTLRFDEIASAKQIDEYI